MSGDRDNALGLYISIPFCRSKCTYCNFASGVYPASEHARYVDRLIEDCDGAGSGPRPWVRNCRAGSTPFTWAVEHQACWLPICWLGCLRDAGEFDFDPDAEITVECAPGQIADETLAALVAAGVNRVSLGVQSFIDREAQRKRASAQPGDR